MTKKTKNKEGLALVPTILIVAVILAIGAGAYYWSNKKEKSVEPPAPTQPPGSSNTPPPTSSNNKAVPPQKILKVAIGLIPKQFSPDFCPKVSADGSKIVFQKSGAGAGGSEGKPEEGGLWIMNADGTGIKQLTKDRPIGTCDSFGWSPIVDIHYNDRYVFYIVSKPAPGKFPDRTFVLKVVNQDGDYTKELTAVDEFVAFPRWISVTDIAYIDRDYPSDNGPLKIVGVDGNIPVRQGNEVALVYADYRNNALDQGVIKSVTFDGVVKQLTPDTESAAFPVLSPDGKKVAYISFSSGKIIVMDIDGSGKVQIGSGENPSWSFDSSKIAYSVAKEDHYNVTASDIYIVNADGTGNRKVETEIEKGPALNPRWFPDGKHIVLDYDDKGVGTIEILPVK